MIWTLQKKAYRVYHFFSKLLIPFIRVPVPEVIEGEGCIERIPHILMRKGVDNVFIVTDKVLMELGMLKGLIGHLEANHIGYQIFDNVQPNPTIKNVEEGLDMYLKGNCKAIIGFGGGSPMDCAKIIGARVTNPKKTVRKMRGKFRIWNPTPLMILIPTTAGTGSETTIAAVITDSDTHEKFAIVSFKIIPEIAVLDPLLMVGLPPHITSTTGMDALTHAVESYTNLAGTQFTDDSAIIAVRLIFANLEAAYRDGKNMFHRSQMALASFHAGNAFTRAMVGYVHAIAHNLGGMYGTPHGLANAIILPHVLEFIKKDAEVKLAELAIAGGIGKQGEATDILAEKFIAAVKSLNKNMNIPSTVAELKEKDIPLIAKRAMQEANPEYPVPTLMNRKDCERILRSLLP